MLGLKREIIKERDAVEDRGGEEERQGDLGLAIQKGMQTGATWTCNSLSTGRAGSVQALPPELQSRDIGSDT